MAHDMMTLAGLALTSLAVGGGGAWYWRGRNSGGNGHSERLRTVEQKIVGLETHWGHMNGDIKEVKETVKYIRENMVMRGK